MTGTSSEHLRETVVQAVIPHLGDPNLTTARIARTAGVEEADLLAVFPDLDAIMRACAVMMTEQMSVVMDTALELRQVDAIRLDQPLASRLVEVLDIVDAYHRRVRAGLLALELTFASGHGTSRFGDDDRRYVGGQPEFRPAVTRLLEPDRQRLRLPPEILAEAFLSVSGVGARPPAGQVVDFFLHGALAGD